jgi:hypothetical protein
MVIAAYADGRLEERPQLRFERHLADCDYCLNELALLVRAQESTQECEVSQEVLAQVRFFAAAKASFARKPAWAWTAISAAAVLAVLVVSLELREPRVILTPPVPAGATSGQGTPASPTVVHPSAATPPSVRSTQKVGSALELIFPAEGAVIPREKMEFSWREVKGNMDYEILVVTPEGNLIWRGRTEKTKIQLPPDISLTPSQKYFVWVRANLPEGKAVKSAVVSFRIDNR